MKKFWLWLALTVAMLVTLSVFNAMNSIGGDDMKSCFREAVLVMSPSEPCTNLALHHLQQRPSTPVRISLWLDNIFIILYTGTFVLGYVVTVRLRFGRPISAMSRWIVGVLLGLVIAGAVADYAENLQLLAALDASVSQEAAARIGEASVWKFRLFVINVILLIAFTVLARLRGQRHKGTQLRHPT